MVSGKPLKCFKFKISDELGVKFPYWWMFAEVITWKIIDINDCLPNSTYF